eukprot:CAMPEP_0198246434 /NCGR_PEP_ID=MMETSP1446-20131203/45974_1 /TAXON_ID=1461542 ORGANISM="Unidentified sp, Strain CCMP2111" /NCGR_SAMPLE_ID=MMETSP1446 /ASSEMBLY_ACC=CAM_ASM_001112 /LENGTH=143 /DNA_ID=CAMNT_0043930755 /DNA_START=537 /DNA_END=968 /DNA_ORIENTATION=-
MNFKQILFTVAVLAFASSCFVAAEDYYYYDDYYYYYPYYYAPEGASAVTYLSLHGHNPTAMFTAAADTKGPAPSVATTYIDGLAFNPHKKATAYARLSGYADTLWGGSNAHTSIDNALAQGDANVLVKNTANAIRGKYKKYLA